MSEWLIKVFMAANTALIRLSRGRLGTLLARQTVLLLHTTGRKSGRARLTPISYFSCDGFYFLIGSNWGRETNAAWYYNLLACPQTTIEVNGKTIPVEAVHAEGPEYDQLWSMALQRYPPYLNYRRKLRRQIPIVKLIPLQSSDPAHE